MEYKINNQGALNLRAAILRQAVKDYRTALENDDIGAAITLERFFMSTWGQLLSGGFGAFIIDKVRKEVKK